MTQGRVTAKVRRRVRDRHGDAAGQPVEHDLPGCSIAPRASSEDDTRGESVTVGLTLYGPFDGDLLATDELVLAGTPWDGVYDVVGEVARWQSPHSGRKAGLTASLTRTGAS